MKNTKAYLEGKKAYRLGQTWSSNPYKIGTTDWQEWNNGKGDANDKDLYNKLVKILTKRY